MSYTKGVKTCLFREFRLTYSRNSIINSYHLHFRTTQLRLHIPQLTYDGKYYWVDLQLDSLPEGALILKVLNYGEVTRPVTNFSSCKEVILSSQMRIYIPSLQYRLADQTEKTFTEVILKPLPATGGKLTFKVFDFRE